MLYIPKIVIIGRPNTGKSTLFNRLIKQRKSIIDPTPGVTRDIINGEFEYEERKFKIIDTGGLTEEGDELNPLVQKKSNEAIKDADLIIFLVEAQNLNPTEIDYIKLIRKQNKKTLLVANKCDSPEKDHFVSEFYKYGMGEPVPISANHNRNVDVMLDKVLELLPPVEITEESLEIEENNKIIKIAIVGKPNVGKSSILNNMLGKDRSIVSPIAGTTRDSVDGTFEFEGKTLNVIDTAGIRRKSKVFENVEYYSVNRAIKTIEHADVTVLVLDSLEEISEQDKKITDQIVKNGKGFIIALNKWDLVVKTPKILEDKKEMLRFRFPMVDYAPIIPISALTGKGIDNLLKTVVHIQSQLTKRIETSQLNGFIEEVIRKYSPTTKKGVLKIYYGTQTSSAPVHFVFFINRKSLLTENYQSYVINRFREKFGYTGVPIKIFFRDGKKKE